MFRNVFPIPYWRLTLWYSESYSPVVS